MSHLPGGRKTRVYNAQERAAIDPFKAEYLSATSAAARKIIAQNHIFPALWNHWESVGQVLDDGETRLRTEQLLYWLRNVWRVPKKIPLIPGQKYRLEDVLWWTRQKDVFAEIAQMMGLASADSNTPGWFTLRRTAEKNILDGMTVEEKDYLRGEAERMAREGLPRDIQRKLAEEKWYSRFTSQANKRYSEMGLLSLSVVAYTNKSGQLVIDIHDEIATVLGVTSRSFEEAYEDKAKELKRTLLEYVKTLNALINSAGAGSSPTSGSVLFDAGGFPIAPSNLSDKTSKLDLEQLYHAYITQHYRLACRDHQRATPFTRIAADNSQFIDDEYIPRDFTFKSPRSMKQDQLFSFFRHISAREQTHGIQNAFRFKSILSGRKKGSLLPAQYGAGAGAGGNPVSETTTSEPTTSEPSSTQPSTSEPTSTESPTSDPTTSVSGPGPSSLGLAGAGRGSTPISESTTSPPTTSESNTSVSRPGPSPLELAGAGAGAGGNTIVATKPIQPGTVDPGSSAPVRRERVVPRLRGPGTLGPAPVGPAPASSSRLQSSDMLASEEAKKWGVSGKCRRR